MANAVLEHVSSSIFLSSEICVVVAVGWLVAGLHR
jgi:hypothetical protein